MRPEGIEPPAYRFEACRSIQLSYVRALRSSPFYRARGRSRAVACGSRRAEPAHRYARIVFCLGVIHARRSPPLPFRAGSSIGRAAAS
jgi:hypothetical protein